MKPACPWLHLLVATIAVAMVHGQSLTDPQIKVHGASQRLAVESGITRYLERLFPQSNNDKQQNLRWRILDRAFDFVIKAEWHRRSNGDHSAKLLLHLPSIIDTVAYSDLLHRQWQSYKVFLLGDNAGDLEGFCSERGLHLLRLSAEDQQQLRGIFKAKDWRPRLVEKMREQRANILIDVIANASGRRDFQAFNINGRTLVRFSSPSPQTAEVAANYQMPPTRLPGYRLLAGLIGQTLKWQVADEYYLECTGFTRESLQQVEYLLKEYQDFAIITWLAPPDISADRLTIDVCCRHGIDFVSRLDKDIELRCAGLFNTISRQQRSHAIHFSRHHHWWPYLAIAVLVVGVWKFARKILLAPTPAPSKRSVPNQEKDKTARSNEKKLRQRQQELNKLLDSHKRSLRIQENKAALYDVVPPQIAVPIEKKQEQIAKVNQQLAKVNQQLADIKGSDSNAITEHSSFSPVTLAADPPAKLEIAVGPEIKKFPERPWNVHLLDEGIPPDEQQRWQQGELFFTFTIGNDRRLNLHRHQAADLLSQHPIKQIGDYFLLKEVERDLLGRYCLSTTAQKQACLVRELPKIHPEIPAHKMDQWQNMLTRIETRGNDLEPSWRELENLVVAPHRFIRTEKFLLAVMPYYPGISIYQLLLMHGKLSWERAQPLLGQTARILGELHSRNIVHRDVKPHHILCCPDGTCRITGVALSRITPGAGDNSGEETQALEIDLELETQNPEFTMPGKGLGSPVYAAPEQLKDAATVSCAADMWSYAVTCYHVLTGKPLFEGGKNQCLREVPQFNNANFSSPATALSDARASADFIELVRRCLDQAPGNRPNPKQIIEGVQEWR